MTDQPRSEILGGLPRTRPERRSAKRPARAEPAGSPAKPAGRSGAKTVKLTAAPASRPRRIAQPRQPVTPPKPVRPRQIAPDDAAPLAGAVKAAAEVAELGLTLGTRAIRGALSRLPRP